MLLTIGFSGTRKGWTDAQAQRVSNYLYKWIDEVDDLVCVRQGCCVGADEQFTIMCDAMVYPPVAIVGHPPISHDYYSAKAGNLSHWLRKPRGYLSRDRDIVDASNVLIATPLLHETDLPPLNTGRVGGTWYTIQYARNKKIPVYIVYPDGSAREPEQPIKSRG